MPVPANSFRKSRTGIRRTQQLPARCGAAECGLCADGLCAEFSCERWRQVNGFATDHGHQDVGFADVVHGNGQIFAIQNQEVRELVSGTYNRAKKLLLEHRDKLDILAKTLIEKEVLDMEETKKLLNLTDEKVSLSSLQPNHTSSSNV